ncbi:hypothetical protein K6V72_09705 [Ralstonia insidiosa]|jgi:hypothetical protein|uniref:Uncharacterized protein n=1 Tax=Ralstonia insidiosa TaxID=190721 RepID=A0A192A0Z0_9RALS|nr:hypothetical protein [Ralstonia insidiosa]ANJ74003.1 hypothetical protein A9Y76_16775 [Ralstonia insidiosa]KAB0471215.1 hypothetical protein F7R11_00995 [Ralstonia insidiosa]MBE0455857.1 hypothetical protein [Roseovarius sp.]MBY4909266.1 hypothetical protein [Ralstonia insidiosa]
MTVEELQSNLFQLIDVYVTSSTVNDELTSLVNRHDVPVKAILVDLTLSVSEGQISEADAQTIGDILFNYC